MRTSREIAILKLKNRINIYESIKDFLKSIEGIKIVNISSDIAAESSLLADNFHGNPADRLIVATAINKGARLFTKDKQILSWSEFGHIRAVRV